MIGDPYEDRPASHAMHHAYGEGPECWCDGAPAGYMALLLAVLAFPLILILVFS